MSKSSMIYYNPSVRVLYRWDEKLLTIFNRKVDIKLTNIQLSNIKLSFPLSELNELNTVLNDILVDHKMTLWEKI